jgi:predicted O-linked N-acetylglucosamine transferase (SPINDLY family)
MSKKRQQDRMTKPANEKPAFPSTSDINALIELFEQGRYSETLSFARKLSQSHPQFSLGWEMMGSARRMLGHTKEALAPMKMAAALAANDAGIISKLGTILQELGHLKDAETCYRRAVKLAPGNFVVHGNLGVILESLGQFEEAEASYREALKISPDSAQAHYNLGNALRSLGRLEEAASCYRIALLSMRGFAEAHTNLGIAYFGLGRLEEAEACYRRSLQLQPDNVLIHNNLGNTLKDLGRTREAEACYRRAIELKPDFAEAHCHLGFVLGDMIRMEEAQASYRRALQLKPDYFDARGVLLFSMNYGEQGIDECLSEARRYGRMVAEKVSSRFTGWQCTAKPERLRIGFVSGDLRQHPVGHFLEGVLAHIDPQRLELFAYPTHNQTDGLTARIKPHFAAWTPLLGLNDEAAARRIQADGVHILIDLSGHTAHNRLPLFAWKPAPVQVSWLGYFATTGVAEMDYFIADPHTLPAGEEKQFTETVWRLPDTRLCFTAPDADVAVAELPALTNDHITFGCFNSLTKINDRVIALWARLLDAVPGSRLMLKAKQLKEALVQDKMRERFAAHGVAADRLLLEGPEARAEYLAAYNRIDIALDPFPFTGGTTTAECLWMGVPVLTLAGNRLVSRQGVGLLANAGLPDWIAADADDYVGKAVLHASNPQALATLRRSLRQQVLASPIFDGERFARHLEKALHDMWEERKPETAIDQATQNHGPKK